MDDERWLRDRLTDLAASFDSAPVRPARRRRRGTLVAVASIAAVLAAAVAVPRLLGDDGDPDRSVRTSAAETSETTVAPPEVVETPASPETVMVPAFPGGFVEMPVGVWRLMRERPPISYRSGTVVAWTGREVVIWGGGAVNAERDVENAAYDPAADRWRTVADGPLSARLYAQSVWTGTQLIVWGGMAGGSMGRQAAEGGAAYDPATDTWTPLPDAPIAERAGTHAVWTGAELLVWGGKSTATTPELADGAAYDPAARSWRVLAPSPLAPRSSHASVWTGRELVVWGGATGDRSQVFADAAAYDPAKDSWRTLPPSPIGTDTSRLALWSGEEVLVWDWSYAGAAYDPSSDSWRPLPSLPVTPTPDPIWTGRRVLLRGPEGWVGLSPRSSDWQFVATPAPVNESFGSYTAWAGGRVIVATSDSGAVLDIVVP